MSFCTKEKVWSKQKIRKIFNKLNPKKKKEGKDEKKRMQYFRTPFWDILFLQGSSVNNFMVHNKCSFLEVFCIACMEAVTKSSLKDVLQK